MSILDHLISRISAQVRAALPALAITSDAPTVKASLAAGKPIAWIGAPEAIEYVTRDVSQATFEMVLISPKHLDHMQGVVDMIDLAAHLVEPLTVERLTPDAITLGNGPTYPACVVHFTITFQQEI